MYNNSMNRNYSNYQNNSRSGFIPLIIGGVIGYGLGANNNNNRPNCCPVFFPQPQPFFFNPYFNQPFYRNSNNCMAYRKR